MHPPKCSRHGFYRAIASRPALFELGLAVAAMPPISRPYRGSDYAARWGYEPSLRSICAHSSPLPFAGEQSCRIAQFFLHFLPGGWAMALSMTWSIGFFAHARTLLINLGITSQLSREFGEGLDTAGFRPPAPLLELLHELLARRCRAPPQCHELAAHHEHRLQRMRLRQCFG